jgi:branched-chain amino acid transport system permease protein
MSAVPAVSAVMNPIPLNPVAAQAVVHASAQVQRHTASSRVALSLCVLAVGVMLSMPWWADSGLIRSVIELSCYIVIAQMWNLLAGYAGLVSVGQQAYVGVAGYALFVLANKFGVDPYVAAALCLVLPALLAVPAYALLHRLDGPYFAIGTWVVAEVCRLFTSTFDYVGSGSGMTLRAMSKYSLEERELGTLWLSAAMLLLAVGGCYALLRSRYGLALTAMRDNPVAAASQGVDVKRLRFLIYLAAAVGTGMVGAVYYLSALRISPAAGFDANWSSICIFIVMVGGIGSIEGPLIGALLYFTADRLFGRFGATYMVVLGLMTLGMALFARGGLWGLWRQRFDTPWFPLRRHLLRPPPPPSASL